MLKIIILCPIIVYCAIAMFFATLYLTGELELHINSKTRGRLEVSTLKYYSLCFLMSLCWAYTVYLLYKEEQND